MKVNTVSALFYGKTSRYPQRSLQSSASRNLDGSEQRVIQCLCERGVLKNEDGVITSIISKDEAQACEIDELVEKRFSGSLPAFVAAFAKRRDMSERELDEVQRMIDSIRNGGGK